jgi:hypothetical protein
VIVAFSIFGPLTIAIVLSIVFLRKHNPDEERLKRVQAEYAARRALQEGRRR